MSRGKGARTCLSHPALTARQPLAPTPAILWEPRVPRPPTPVSADFLRTGTSPLTAGHEAGPGPVQTPPSPATSRRPGRDPGPLCPWVSGLPPPGTSPSPPAASPWPARPRTAPPCRCGQVPPRSGCAELRQLRLAVRMPGCPLWQLLASPGPRSGFLRGLPRRLRAAWHNAFPGLTALAPRSTCPGSLRVPTSPCQTERRPGFNGLCGFRDLAHSPAGAAAPLQPPARVQPPPHCSQCRPPVGRGGSPGRVCSGQPPALSGPV